MTESADIAIRLRRATFNRALADADLDAIGPLLAPNAIFVAETDSANIAGRTDRVTRQHRWYRFEIVI